MNTNTNTNAVVTNEAATVKATEVVGMFGEAVVTNNTNTEMEMVNMTNNTNTEVVVNNNTNTTEGVVTMTNNTIVAAEGMNKLGFKEVSALMKTKRSFAVNNKKQLMEIASQLIDYTQYSAQGFMFSKEGTIVPVVTGVAKAFDVINTPAIGLVKTGAGQKVVENKIAGVFVIDASSEHGRYVANQISEYGAWLDAESNLYFKKNSLTEGMQLIDTRTNAAVDASTLELTEFAMFGGSAAAFRRHSYIVVRADLMGAMVKMFNGRYNNAYDIALKDQTGSRKEQSKMGRMAHGLTPQTIIGQLTNYAVFTGKLMNGGNDGQSYANAGFMVEALTVTAYEKLGLLLEITVEKTLGNSLQGRPATAKEQTSIAASSFINNAINVQVAESKANVVVVEKSEMDAEKSKALFALPNTMIIVVEDKETFKLGESRIDWLADRNAIKLEFDLSTEIDFYMLKAIKSTGRATLNGQVMSKFIHLKDGMEYVRGIMKAYIQDSMKSIEDAMITGEGFVTEKQLASSDVDGTMKKLFMSTVVSHFPNIEKRYLNNLWTEMSKKISKLRFEVEGDYLTVEADSAKLMGANTDLLAIDEVFVNNKKLAAKIEKMLLIKYPSVHVREFLIAKLVTHKTVTARIAAKVAAGEMTSKQGDILETYYFTLSDAKIVISSDDSLKGMLAGLDFDTDAIMAFYDKKLVEMVEAQSSPLMVIIDGLKANDTNTYDLSVDGFGKLVQNNISGEGMSIGMITHISEIFSSLLAFDREKAARLLQSAFRKSTRSEAYVGLRRGKHTSGYDMVHVTEADAVRITNDLAVVTNINANNVHLIIEDLIAIARYVQETSIDFAKTGVNTLVNIVLEVLGKDTEGNIKLKSLKSVWHCPITDNRIMKTDEVFKGLTAAQINEKKKQNNIIGDFMVNHGYKRNDDMNAYLGNVLHDLREEGLAIAKAEIETRLTAINTKGFSPAVREQYEGFMKKHPMSNMFKAWKGTYNDIQSEYNKAISGFHDTVTGETVKMTDAEIEYARTVRKQKLDALAATIRVATEGMSLVARGHAMMAMSIVSNQTGKVRTDFGTGFYTVLPLELFAMFDAITQRQTGKSAGLVAKEIFVNVKKNVINGVEVVKNGTRLVFDEVGNANSDLVLPDTELNGEYIVRVMNGKFLACKSITSVINEIEKNNTINVDEASFVLSINYNEDRRKVFEAIKNEQKLIITASKEHGDYVRNEKGEAIAKLLMPEGNSNLAKVLNGKMFDIATAELREGNEGFVSIVVVVKNGVFVQGNYTRPSGLITKAPSVAEAIMVSDEVLADEYADTEDMFA